MSYEDVESDEEKYLMAIINNIKERYTNEAKPYIDRLTAIRLIKNPQPINITIEQAKAMGLIPEDIS